jgi:hypothetical protein
MRIPRVILAAIVAPIVTPLAGWVWLVAIFWNDLPPLASFLLVGLPLLLFAYCTMLLVGLPAYYLLRRFGIFSVWTAAASGFVAQDIAYLGIVLITAWQRGSSLGDVFQGFVPTPSFWIFVVPLLPVGSIIAVLFWFVAGWGSSTKSAES